MYSLDMSTPAAAPATIATTIANITNSNSPTVMITSASSDNSDSFSVGVIVAIVVFVFIIITVVVVGIVVVWKRKKSEQHTKQEGVYYSTIDETTLQRPPTHKPEPVYSEMNDGQDSKEPQYMDIAKDIHSTKQVVMEDNPAYSTKAQDYPVPHSTPTDQKIKMQDNPAYSITSS